MIEVWVFTRGIMRALRNYEIDNLLPAPRRRRGERSGQLTNARPLLLLRETFMQM